MGLSSGAQENRLGSGNENQMASSGQRAYLAHMSYYHCLDTRYQSLAMAGRVDRRAESLELVDLFNSQECMYLFRTRLSIIPVTSKWRIWRKTAGQKPHS